ncbi:MAG: hypothetical protein ONB51_21875 [candidate division KSB1 bacterium]|nr:hypothetical protein [candidate division KSB1 bacterium]
MPISTNSSLLTEFYEHDIDSGEKQASMQNSGSTTVIQPSVSGSHTNNPPTKAEIPRKKSFRGSPFSWEGSRDAFGKRANFEVRTVRHSKKVLLDFERNNCRHIANTSFLPGDSKPAGKIQGGTVEALPPDES